MERKIGEKFEFNGAWYVVLPERFDCAGCAFVGAACCLVIESVRGVCNGEERTDHAGVIFARCEPPTTEEKKENAELTKREKIALAVLQSLMESPKTMDVTPTVANYVATAFQFADEFLKKAGE